MIEKVHTPCVDGTIWYGKTVFSSGGRGCYVGGGFSSGNSHGLSQEVKKCFVVEYTEDKSDTYRGSCTKSGRGFG